MIIEMLLAALYRVMDLLMVIDIPDLPTEVYSYVDQAFTYMITGAGILANYTPFVYVMTLFGVMIAVDVGVMLYHFVMWIIRKIPMLGMS